jgi:hypothetical protein
LITLTLSKEQIEFNKVRWQKWFWIWERDLHWLANQYDNWVVKANELGYRTDWITRAWPHSDAGKQIRYMEIPKFT